MRNGLRVAGALVGTAALLALAACSGDSGSDSTDGSGDAAGGDVEVFTWWAAGSEKAGLDALVSVFGEQHPDYTFVNGAVAGGAGSAAKDLLQTRLQANDPPDTFQAHAGAELTDYIDAAQIEDISDLYDEFGVTDVFPQDLIDLLTVDGQIYSMPSNIHRSNMVWANPAVLIEAGLDPAATYATLDDWFTALDAVQATGKTPLSVAQTWTQVNLLETVLMAALGADAYNGLWDGSTDWESPEVTAALEDFQKLMSYTNTDRDGLDWPEATQLVMDGEAAFNVMGDWAVAAFEEADKTAGTDFTYFPVPGTDGMFGFLADSFTLPVGAKNPDGTKAWIETVASLEGQTAFNQAKGSIPARTDADPADFSEYQQTAITSFADDTIVPSLAHGAAASVAVLNAISDATSKFTSGASDLAQYQADLAAATAE
ncbi:carbohydrate ABC transporter substrate-binding protein [Oerskovia turbata]|uniref:Probable sugar-binding periplasmic protein n=1 Tax=Oerskovia turbata TaxID=1713 RepID=A0A4V1N3X5_9CELL|nr:ABC transporter substrate-binding protein [Oerskovia turbata]RXR25743.1 carbohydrate ABC transporter substrate-binding protein [Oerskovia turbata]RXR30186.1 carbohydrate ABC transporter substrate-binding protein [Oerskovia turbata]TGJ96238.1 carbohydrate ABC transporter substrate-binding protein [Actinotalea fermentans ATCC 43279 = JCM 9966 = DSM 3133]